nr:MAG TPA: hypothetical protein [Caudoviricetes sp.]
MFITKATVKGRFLFCLKSSLKEKSPFKSCPICTKFA